MKIVAYLLVVAAYGIGFITIVSRTMVDVEQARFSSQEKDERTSDAMQALEFWSQARVYPNSDIPPDKFYKAFQQSQEIQKKSGTNSPMSSSWESLGPLNASGRLLSVAVNPKNINTVYVGSASGGLWRSYTGGIESDWQRVPTGFPVLGVAAIAIDSADTNTMYIGTGEVYRYQDSHGGVAIRTTRGSYGMGILKTIDAGKTWTKSLDWSYAQQRGVEALAFNPQNHNTIFAATTEGIFRTQDGGISWACVLDVPMGEDILVKPTDTSLVMASCGNFNSPGAGIYISIAGGDSGIWFPTMNGLPSYSGKAHFDYYAADPNIIYASVADSTTSVGGVYRTSNFGMNWQLVKHYPDSSFSSIYGVQGWYSHFVAVHPTNPTKIIHAAVDMSYSTNGGRTFVINNTNTHADHHAFAHVPGYPDMLYEANDAGVTRTTDFGESFEYASQGLQTAQFYNGFANSPTDSSFAFGQMQDNIPGFVYLGSTDWSEINIDEVGWSAIDPTNNNLTYSVDRQGQAVRKSLNRGGSYSYTAFGGLGAWNSPIVLSPSNRNVLYLGKAIIHKTTNAGYNWFATNNGNTLDGNPVLSMAVSATNPDTVYVGTVPIYTRAHLFRSTNGGMSWQNVTASLPDRYPMDIAVDRLNPAVVYAVFGGYGTGHVFKSVDAGENWSNISGTLPDANTSAVIVDPFDSHIVYVGNDIGVYASTDAGITWVPFNDGLPEAVIVSDLGVCAANRSLRASTHGNGLFQRKLLSRVTSVTERRDNRIPTEFALGQNYPNPFNPATNFQFSIANSQLTILKVYDALGREVATVVNEVKQPGEYSVRWDAGTLPSGVYVYSLVAGKFSDSKKMLLIR